MLKLFRYLSPSGPRLGLETPKGRFDLTGVSPDRFDSLGSLLSLPDPVAAIREASEAVAEPVPTEAALLAPVDTQEVWAAGVTYERSKVARQEESAAAGGGDFYDRVYSADRPEIFFKSAGWRVMGPGTPIHVRPDSTWDVPEPEMTLVLSSAGKIVGVTVGNDVSSRSIEGENPLYLPQAKSYNGSCAIGPSILVLDDDSSVSLTSLPIRLAIRRGSETVFSGETSTSRMKRTAEELSEWLFRELSFPQGALLMTGTGIIPTDTFTLTAGDVVTITIGGVGTLTNPVA